ncbi:MAG: right-handed parallel beta-helix repeat-containing protein [Lewinellaceae bacterium]|nr:right-handed parallel beta-helix repeat-containing protein [Saprospiraceae bacterium]MCB9334386.1 right-handed parallel beta-helix repeat-containing protein [Lewinellaceae bacterium]
MKKKNLLPLLVIPAICLLPGCLKDNPETPKNAADTAVVTERGATILPAGSVNQLAAALQNSATVILEPGLHIESDPVVVSGYHHIVGRPGAVLRMGSTPYIDFTLPIFVALHFKDAGGSSIRGVKIEPVNPIGGTAILLENSQKAVVQDCEISGFQYCILVEKSPLARVFNNKIAASTAWQTGDIPDAHGIVVINGDGATVEKNDVSGGLFGIWACDKNGALRSNTVHDNYIGIILCKVPAGAFILPDGTATGAQYSCTKWVVRNNQSTDNLDAGYLVIDGANHNTLVNNEAGNNGTYDYELTGDTYRFGFLTPFAFNNTLKAGAGQTVKDCGQNNVVSGGIKINTSIDPCN